MTSPQELPEPRLNVKLAKYKIAGLSLIFLFVLYKKIETYYYGTSEKTSLGDYPLTFSLMVLGAAILYYSVRIAYEKERGEEGDED
jgi:hypothetical protein